MRDVSTKAGASVVVSVGDCVGWRHCMRRLVACGAGDVVFAALETLCSVWWEFSVLTASLYC